MIKKKKISKIFTRETKTKKKTKTHYVLLKHYYSVDLIPTFLVVYTDSGISNDINKYVKSHTYTLSHMFTQFCLFMM